ncbi:hypothetical protein JCM30237_02890 [Halolamina litorea]|uniref:SHOCT domain-containing protein n=1 Tax=Halolamina litorea TaxID=1515593 RepID=A0ABD6BS85_9EURY|nr:hypothetical protein [Halolamina litorea]
MSSDGNTLEWPVLASTSVILLPMLAIVLLIPILVGLPSDTGPVDSTLTDALVVGWLVVVFVVFVLGTATAARLVREGRRDAARDALRLALARGEVSPDEYRERAGLLESEN